MDKIYEDFIKTFHRENLMIENQTQTFMDFFPNISKDSSPYNENEISITKLKNGKFFISNGASKGFFLERNTDIEIISAVSEEYRKIQKSVGKVTDLFGFTNRYFENIIELFPNDKDSIGLGDFTAEFLGRTNNERIIGEINIDNLFTIAYEANGNRIVLNKNNCIYIYGHDLATHHYQKINGIPDNTFYTIPQINSLNDFLEAFWNDFFTK